MRLERLASEFESIAALAQRNIAVLRKKSLHGFRDELQFLAGWTRNPLKTGAIAPSGTALSTAMAQQVDPSVSGPVIELGPGTGVITRALIARGIAEDRLVLIEANGEFAEMLRKRFPRARIVIGDAYDLSALSSELGGQAPAAIVSGLPLFNRPLHRRISLVNAALNLLHPNGAFVQFSYHVLPPVSREHGAFRLNGSKRIWKNVPPARVWVYSKRLH